MEKRKLEMLMSMLSHTDEIVLIGEADASFEAMLDEEARDWVMSKLHEAYLAEAGKPLERA